MHAVENAEAVDVDEIAPLRRILLVEPGETGDAGIVDEAVDRAEPRLTLPDRACERIIVTDVGGDREHVRKRHRLDQFGSAGDQKQGITGSREDACGFLTDAGACAGDHDERLSAGHGLPPVGIGRAHV